MKTIKIQILFAVFIRAAWPSETVFEIPCYLQSVTDTSAVVRWKFLEPADCSVVYGRPGSDMLQAPCRVQDGYGEAFLESLQPSARYVYNLKLGDTLILSDTAGHAFFTAPADKRESITFSVIGDTRSGDESFHSDHADVIQSILNYSRPSFHLHLGDLVDATEKGSWQTFFGLESDLLSQVPIYPVRGNSDGSAEDFLKHFHLPGSKTWYSFSYGPIFVIGLDIQFKRSAGYYQEHIGPESEQYRWLARQLTSPERRDALFTAVMSYAPLFPPNGNENAYLIETLHTLFKKHEVDLVLNGGIHNFIASEQDGILYIITGGGGAALESPGRADSPYLGFFHQAFHHCRVSIHFPAMTVEGLDNSGTVFYSKSLILKEKRNEAGSERGVESPFVLHLYGTADCGDCRRVKEEIFPACLKALPSAGLELVFHDMDDEREFEEYLAMETRMGGKKHNFPVMKAAGRLLSGDELTSGSIVQLIKKKQSSGIPGGSNKEHRQSGPASSSARMIMLLVIFSCAIVFIFVVIFFLFKKKKQG